MYRIIEGQLTEIEYSTWVRSTYTTFHVQADVHRGLAVFFCSVHRKWGLLHVRSKLNFGVWNRSRARMLELRAKCIEMGDWDVEEGDLRLPGGPIFDQSEIAKGLPAWQSRNPLREAIRIAEFPLRTFPEDMAS